MSGWSVGFWGTEYWGSSLQIRTRAGEPEVRYVLFIDGIGVAFTSETPCTGTITGSGAQSWIGRSEAVLPFFEVTGQRTVKSGLVVPETIDFGGDPKGLGLDRSTVTFQIVDQDDTVAALFATEGVDPDILQERLPPGTTSLGTSVSAVGPISLNTGALNPRGKWIGLERIGPTGQRRFFHCFPFQGIGMDHPGDVGDRIPQTPISTTPILHAGRVCTLYRIYADPSISSDDPDRWITWDEAHTAGDLVWWGVMQDSGTYTGNRVWSIECYGPEALLEKGLGQITSPASYKIRSTLGYEAGVNDQIWISFAQDGRRFALDDGGDPFDAPLLKFEGRQWTTLTGNSKDELIPEIDDLIKDTAAGTGTDYDTANDFYDAWEGADDAPGFNAGLDGGLSGGFWVRKNWVSDPVGNTQARSYGVMYVAMHRRVWMTLGFDPILQDLPDEEAMEKGTDVYFRKLQQGELFSPGDDEAAEVVPGSGYYLAMFHTVGVGAGTGNNSEYYGYYDNDGNARYFSPLFEGDEAPVVLNQDGSQQIFLDGGSDSPFWEGQPTVPRTSDAQTGGTDTELARWFAVRGKIRVATGSTDDGTIVVEDEVDRIAVCDASWQEGDHYGEVSTGGGLGPALFIQNFHDPRLFGFNHRKLKSDWVGTVDGDDALTIAPLHTYTFGHGKPIEWAHLLFPVLLLSTGTSEGFDAPLSEGGVLDLGANSMTGVTSTGDVELADLGLGIPHQMVAPFSEISKEFAKQAGGLNGDLNRMRLCYAGPFQSRDAIEAILKPRRLVVGLHGKKYGVYRYEQFSPDDVDVVITEGDLYGTPGDPTTVIPSQAIRAHGAIDGAKISYGVEPGGSAQLEHRQSAIDYGSRWRRGDLIEPLNGQGLLPVEWLQGTDHEGKEWQLLFREEWGVRAPRFFSKRHFVIEDLKISRPKGQDVMPGTRILLSNPWPLAPDGTYGLNNRLGVVIGVSINTRHHYTSARVLVYGDVDFPPHFAPFVYVTNIAGATLTYDVAGTRSGYAINECETERGWTRPDWTTLTAAGVVRLWYQTPTGGWTTAGTGTVSSINTLASTITLTGALSAEPPPNTYTMILVFEDLPDQSATFWGHDVYAPVTSHNGTYDGGTVIGKKWLE